MKQVFLFFFIIFFLLSCNPKKEFYNQDGLLIKRSFFTNKNIKTEQSFLHDTIRHGYYKEYFQDNTLMKEIHYVNGLKHGLALSYYPNGNLKSLNQYDSGQKSGNVIWWYDNRKIEYWYSYRKGKRNGRSREFYQNWKLKSVALWRNDRRIMSETIYHSNGNPKEYLFRHLLGGLTYRAYYNKKGDLIREEREPKLHYVYDTPDTIVHKIGDTLRVTILKPEPPGKYVKVYYGKVKRDNLLLLSEENGEEIDFFENGQAKLLIVLKEKTGYYWGYRIELVDRVTGEVSVFDDTFTAIIE